MRAGVASPAARPAARRVHRWAAETAVVDEPAAAAKEEEVTNEVLLEESLLGLSKVGCIH